ncbi:hypothetical protein ACFQ6S_41820 [Streptomyces sp. NPDC056479]|uniref:hypothetical protein n=1 Tax=Streptomyces sp. NPDC056479 TaxID=3345832 RepID=UPI00367DFFCC
MKTMLLFFHGIALSLPQDLADRMIDGSPELAQPLLEQGLLINLEPDAHLQPGTASALARDLQAVIERFDGLDRPSPDGYEDVGFFHWGGIRARLEAEELTRTMVDRGIAIPLSVSRGHIANDLHGDERLYDVDPAVRLLILNAYCQALHKDLRMQSNVMLQPVVEGAPGADASDTRWQMRRSFAHLYAAGTADHDARGYDDIGIADRGPLHDAVRVVASDLHAVSVDLSAVPLDEVLGFRTEHHDDFLAYARGLRDLLRLSEDLSTDQFLAELHVRQEHIRDEAAALKSAVRKAFGKAALGAALSIAGATWTATEGDLVGALLAAAGAGVSITRPPRPVTTYSYVLKVDRELAR